MYRSADRSVIYHLRHAVCIRMGKALNLWRTEPFLDTFPEHYVSITARRFISSAGRMASCNVSAAERSRGPRDLHSSHHSTAGGEQLSGGRPTPQPPQPPDCHLRLKKRGGGGGGGGVRHLYRFFYERPEQRLHLYHRCGSISAARSRV